MSTLFVPTQLSRYTGGAREVAVTGGTLRAALADLERQFPGIRFRAIDEQDRIRAHMRVFVDGERALTLDVAVGPGSEIHLFGALSGG